MHIGGLQKNSMIDYPGKLACVLFLSGCNFDCPYCHNPQLATGCAACPNYLKGEKFFDFLEERKGFLDGVVISGGEPTLQDDLLSLCEKIKNMGYPVKLDTNGSRPKIIKKLIDSGLIDYLAMDIKTDPADYSPLIKKEINCTQLLSSIRLIMESNIPYEFKTTCIRPLINEEVIERIAHMIQGARLYALQKFRNSSDVLQPDFFSKEQRGFSDDELNGFRLIADKWVGKCILR